VHRPRCDERVAVHGEGHAVGGEPDAEPRREARHELALAACHGAENRARRLLGGEVGEGTRPHLAAVGRQPRVLEEPDLAGAPLAELLQARVARLVGEPHGLHRAAPEARRRAEHLGHHLLRGALPIVLDDAPESACHGLPPPQMAFASSRSARTSSLTAVGTSPWMTRPEGRGGSASSPTTESCEGSDAIPRSAAFTSLISFFLAPMMPFSVGYRGSLSPFCAASTAGSGRSKTSRPPSTWRAARTALPSAS